MTTRKEELEFLDDELSNLRADMANHNLTKEAYLNACQSYKILSELREKFVEGSINFTDVIKTALQCGTMVYIAKLVLKVEEDDCITSTIFPPLLKMIFRTGGY